MVEPRMTDDGWRGFARTTDVLAQWRVQVAVDCTLEVFIFVMECVTRATELGAPDAEASASKVQHQRFGTTSDAAATRGTKWALTPLVSLGVSHHVDCQRRNNFDSIL